MNHKLMKMLLASEATEEEIEELFHDLKHIYENSFDSNIEEAIVKRGATYIEIVDQKAN